MPILIDSADLVSDSPVLVSDSPALVYDSAVVADSRFLSFRFSGFSLIHLL